MNRDQIVMALSDKLRELDFEGDIVCVVALNSGGNTRVIARSTDSPFTAIQYAQTVLDIAAAVKKKVGEL